MLSVGPRNLKMSGDRACAWYPDDSPCVCADFGIALILAAIAITPGASQRSGSGISGSRHCP
jgi:hypothetical protein